MEQGTRKGRPLTKEENKALLNLIRRSKIINNHTTNATTNRMKNDEWDRITNIFNATVATSRRSATQLRLKWENLKKTSRRRSSKLIMNRIKGGGGPPVYIPPDEILDQVTSLLGSTDNERDASFDGDAETSLIGGSNGSELVDSEGSKDGFDRAHKLNSPIPISSWNINQLLPVQNDPVGPNDQNCSCIVHNGRTEVPQPDENGIPFNKFMARTGQDTGTRCNNKPTIIPCQDLKRKEMLTTIHKMETEINYFKCKMEKIELEKIKLKLEIKALTDKQ